MFCDQVARVLSEEPDMEVCGTADNVTDAMALALQLKPDLALVDITLKDGRGGLDFIKDLRAQKSEMPILVLSMHQESLYAERVLQSGGRGYIGKSQPASELKRAIREILRGEVYLSSEMISNLLKRIASGDATVVKTGVESLSDRELEIFRMLGEGGNMKEIAKALNLGNSTVESYRAHIRQKLGVASAAQLYSVAAIWVREQKL